jgi:hypothetical protein
MKCLYQRLSILNGMFVFCVLSVFFFGCAAARKSTIDIPTVELANVCTRVDEINRVCDCSQQVFSCSADRTIFACFSLRYVNTVHDVIFEWYAPDNTLYHATEPVQMSEPDTMHEQVLVYQRLDITQMNELGMTGNWRLTVRLDGEIVNTHTFAIVE